MVMGELSLDTQLLVIGSGPGGYAAAFRAADLGLEVTMVDTDDRPGGECLFRGCIPSKTLLYLAELIHDAKRAAPMGLTFGEPKIDLDAMRQWKEKVMDRLADGLVTLSQKRGVERIRGKAVFEGANSVILRDSDVRHIRFRHAIVATGSSPIVFPGTAFNKGGRIINSAGALELNDIPETLLVIGGGYVGLELGSVYASLGSRVTLVEQSDRLMTGVDQDLVKPLQNRLKTLFKSIHLNVTIKSLTEDDQKVKVAFDGNHAPPDQSFDRVLIAIGRKPNTLDLGLENTGVKLADRDFIRVDNRQCTHDPSIYAVGDVVGGFMLAHKAQYEGKIAAEVIAGKPSTFDARAIPAVVFTDPQVAWCGLTEESAKKENRIVKIHRFPWKYSGRAITMDAAEGMTKMIVDAESERILGLGIVGRDTEGLIAEGALAIEMGALAQDIALTIHAHPTLSETEMETAEIFLGSATHIISPNKK
jgi:dihydrolipoamide dehydrogenase